MEACLMQSGQKVPVLEGQFGNVSKSWGTSSKIHDNVSCGGVSVDLLKTSDQMLAGKVGIHYSYTVHTLQLEEPLQKTRCSAMDRIDMPALYYCLEFWII